MSWEIPHDRNEFTKIESINKYLQDLQKAVAKVVNEKQYDWKVVRVSLDGDVEFE